MTLTLRGHDRKPAAEQALLNYFPPWVEGEAVSSLHTGQIWLTAAARLRLADGRTARGVVRGRLPHANADRMIRECFYRAARKLLPDDPPWGSLTGIRPAKAVAGFWETLPDTFGERQRERAVGAAFHLGPERRRLAVECARAAAAERGRLEPRDVALYVGVPFCPSRCAYCSFVSSDVARSHRLVEPFVARLTEEIALTGRVAADLGLRPVTLYIGGGTPTVLEPDALGRVLDALYGAFGLEACTEITVEAGRPDTLTADKLAVLRGHGVTRVSVNPQSFRDAVLRAIGRKHTARQARDALSLARAAGFPTINADLIAGLPGDTPKGFARSLEELLTFRPENLTIHTLARKKGAAIWEDRTRPASAAAVRERLDAAYTRLREAGYAPYYLYRQKFMAGGCENVGWTLPGHASRYNLHMMEELTTVLAMGSGVTKLVRPTGRDDMPWRIDRIANCKFPLEYLEKHDKIEGNLEKIRALLTQPVPRGTPTPASERSTPSL